MAGLRVAFVSTYPPIHCGVGEYTRMLLSAMSEREPGLEPLVLAEAGVGGGYRDEPSGALVVPSFRQADPSSLRGVVDRLQEYGPVDVIHVQHEYGIFGRGDEIVRVADEARRERLARAVVFTMHTVYHPLTADHGEDRVQDAVLSEADGVIVHSAQQEFELHAQLGGYPSNLHRIPHGTSVNPYLSTPRRVLARRLGLEGALEGRMVLSLVGFIRPDKGLDTLLEALEELDAGDRLAVIVGGEVRD
nr:glycosyltransferase [Desulfurococcales archaeon]